MVSGSTREIKINLEILRKKMEMEFKELLSSLFLRRFRTLRGEVTRETD